MNEFSFYKTMKGFDLIVSDMNDTNKKNNIMFRRICREVFQKSYAKLELQNNLGTGAKMLGVGIASAIKMARNRYERNFFEKSIQKLNHQDNIPSHSDIVMTNRILEDVEFVFAVKLLKIQYRYGLVEAISSASHVEVVYCKKISDSSYQKNL